MNLHWKLEHLLLWWQIIGPREERELLVGLICDLFGIIIYVIFSSDLGRAVAAACRAGREDPTSQFKFLYPLEMPLKEKISVICREVYGADGADFSELAESRLQVDCLVIK